MKKMKKVLSLILAMVMVLSLGSTSVQAAGRGQEGWSSVTYGAAESEAENAAEVTAEEPAAPAAETEAPAEEPAAPAEEPAAPAEEPAAPAEEPAAPAEEPAAPAEEPAAPAEEPAAPAPAYPAVTLAGTTEAGVTVRVESPEGALPEGAYMTLKDVSAEEVQAKVAGEIAGRILTAVDITFLDSADNEIQPNGNVAVSIKAPELAEAAAQDLGILHINEEKAVAEELTEAENAVEVNAADENAVAFESDAFSIYAVVESGEDARLFVKFMNGDKEEITTMMINKRQIPHIGQYIYDPGMGELQDGVQFRGWTQEESYTSETPSLTIEDVREEIKGILNKDGGVTDGETVIYYAMTFKVYTVVYLDEKNNVVKIDQILTQADSTEELTYEVNYAYTPYPVEDEGVVANFKGWQQLVPVVPGEEVLYENSDTFKLTATNYTLKAKVEKGHWITYETNLTNANPPEPEFVVIGGRPSTPAAPTRAGYSFAGWYTEDASEARDGQVSGSEFDFGELESNITVYGKWNKATRADYSVMIWFQKASGTGYDYSGTTVTVTGATVGANTYNIVQQGSGDSSYARIYRNNSQYTDYNNFTGFHLASFDQPKEVAPEGNTVINVYYDRKLITFNFRYSNNNIVTQTGLYRSLVTEWPDPGNGQVWCTGNGYPLPSGVRFYDAKEFLGVDENATTINMTRMQYDGSINVYMYGQTVSGQWDYTEDNLIGFYKMEPASFTTNDLFEGFTVSGYRLGTTSGQWTNATPSTSIRNVRQDLYIRYTRNKNEIIYNDGVFVDAAGNPLLDAPAARTNFEEKQNIYYEADISGSEYNFTPELDGYVFLGWYDNALCEGDEYTFDKMPDNNVTLYAKWARCEYEINLHPNDSTGDPIKYNSTEQLETFYIDDGEKIGNVGGERIYYDLVGWFTDEALTKVYSFDAFVVNKQTVERYGKLYSAEEIDPDYPATVGELNLYAKWRSKLIGADGINVVYDAGEGDNAPDDNITYVDGAQAIAGAASTPTDTDNLVFSHWEVMKWNGTAYVPAGVDVFPSEYFTVNAADARITDRNGNTVSADALDSGESYTYTVQLKAAYIEKDKKVLTHINWYKNDGETTAPVATSVGLEINEGVTIIGAQTRPGYKFLGWAKENEYDHLAEDGSTTDESVPQTSYPNLGEANLFLKYFAAEGETPAHFEAEIDGSWTPVTEVAADEFLPYKALYAVWEKVDYIYVFHSNTRELEAIKLYAGEGNTGEKVTYDFVAAAAADNTYYGGCYTTYGAYSVTDEDKIAALKEDGLSTTLTHAPVYNGTVIKAGLKKYWLKKNIASGELVADTVYYIKEVPKTYLTNYTQYIYNYKSGNNELLNLFFLTAVDDTNYNGVYFKIKSTDGYEATVCSAFTIQEKDEKQTKTKVSVSDINSGLSKGFIGVYEASAMLKPSEVITIQPYWITHDNVTVYGETRTLNLGDCTTNAETGIKVVP